MVFPWMADHLYHLHHAAIALAILESSVLPRLFLIRAASGGKGNGPL